MQWVYEPTEADEINARAAAMGYADARLRGRVAPKQDHTDLERLALALRQSELTWGDREQPGVKPLMVRVSMAGVFWAVVLANITVAILAALLYALNRA